MGDATSEARWRKQPIAPPDYEDVPALIKMARRLRQEVVEFEWVFRRDELISLRRAIFERGSHVQGTYKVFDSRVLEAINSALGEPGSLFSLQAAKKFDWVDCRAACDAEGDRFRLHGHATFDLIFGYAEAGVQEATRGHAFLTQSVKAALAASLEPLGWDLTRLLEDRCGPVRAVLYGMSPNSVTGPVPPHSGPELQRDIAFQGPFAATDDAGCRCLFTDEVASKTGVYLWTVDVGDVAWPWYVGQTRRGFGQRTAEHLAAILSGQYPPLDAEALARGENKKAAGAVSGDWPQTLPAFLRNWKQLEPDITRQIRLVRFHVAPFTGDGHLHDRVEGAIGRHFKTHAVPRLKDFFWPGLKLPAAIPGDRRLRLRLSSEAPIAGLPLEILEPAMPLPPEVRQFIESARWTFAKTYAATWPHEYIVRTPENEAMLLALARHIFEHGVAGRFYSQVRRYHHEGGQVYWSMDDTPEATSLINRCEETQTYETRQAARTLPGT